MKRHLPWHHSRLGSIVLWLGSIQLAVPVLALTAIALALGTYIDSTQSSDAARAAVYGSRWFLAIMILVCVSLVFAVISRFPWKRRHVGFMTVHASLIALIVGGFTSLYGRQEGQLSLEEGQSTNLMESMDHQVELVEHNAGQFRVLATAPISSLTSGFDLNGTQVHIVERWGNCKDEQVVNDDVPMPFRAVQVSAQTGFEPSWVGEEGRACAAPVLAGLLVRVLADGQTWQPATEDSPSPASPASPSAAAFAFTANGRQFPLPAEGQEAFPGWTVLSVKHFTHAFVGNDGLIELSSGNPNPAIDVIITDNKGASERHTAFLNFPEMKMRHQVEGASDSGARLAPVTKSATETLVVFGTIDSTSIGYISPTGDASILATAVVFPKVLDLPSRRVTLNRQFARAKGGWHTLKAEPGKRNRPALVLRVGDSTDLSIVSFKAMVPVAIGGQNLLIRFVPQTVALPFEVRLNDFRKSDYPGTDMAMAFESEVEITHSGNVVLPFTIHMNHPFAFGSWKVYQSGFVGDKVTILSVMKDPGLPLTYFSCAFLCVGIILTFFARSFSWGHPGIPAQFLH